MSFLCIDWTSMLIETYAFPHCSHPCCYIKYYKNKKESLGSWVTTKSSIEPSNNPWISRLSQQTHIDHVFVPRNLATGVVRVLIYFQSVLIYEIFFTMIDCLSVVNALYSWSYLLFATCLQTSIRSLGKLTFFVKPYMKLISARRKINNKQTMEKRN